MVDEQQKQPITVRREDLYRQVWEKPMRRLAADYGISGNGLAIEGIAKGRLWLNELVSGTSASTQKIATRECCSERSVRMTLSLAFLSPVLVKSAIEGTLPYGVGTTQFIEPPLDWNDQLARLR